MKVTVATRQMCDSLRIYNVSPCVTLCCTDVALRCTETPQLLLHRRDRAIARGTLSSARHPAGTQALGEGLCAAPFLGMETRRGFGAAGWVLSGSSDVLTLEKALVGGFRCGTAGWSPVHNSSQHCRPRLHKRRTRSGPMSERSLSEAKIVR